jgi:hypothetical protein
MRVNAGLPSKRHTKPGGKPSMRDCPWRGLTINNFRSEA